MALLNALVRGMERVVFISVPRWLIRLFLVTAGVDPEPNRKS